MLGDDGLDELKSVHVPTHLYVHEEERNDMIQQHQNEEFIDGLETYRLKRKDGRLIDVNKTMLKMFDVEIYLTRILSVNPSFLRIFGFNSQDELFDRFKNARAVRDDADVLLYYEGFLQDITERKKAQEDLYRISIHDHLTGICNRRYIFERLDAMVNEFQRETRHFSLSIIDLDHFKRINDTHGHQAGDFILREFASMLSDCFRPYDLVGRYGGEEFVVVAMNIDILQTQNMLERLREMVRDRVFEFNGIHIRIAFSAGVANTGETGLEMTMENLIRKADERLYLAKEQGRDRIIYE